MMASLQLLLLLQIVFLNALSASAEIPTIEVPLRKSFKMTCVNQTEGSFRTLIWTTNAYALAKYSVYSIGINEPEVISANYKNRLRRFKSTSLEISSAKVTDAGLYECNLLYYVPTEDGRSGLRKKLAASFNVVVISSPIIASIKPISPSIKRFSSGQITCHAQGLSPFSMSWKLSHKGLPKSNYNITETSGYKNGYHTRELNFNILNMTKDFDSKITCVARNIAGKVSKKVRMKILTAPTITSEHTFQAHINKEIIIHCNATAIPPATFTWEFFKTFEPIKLKENERLEKYSVSATTFYRNGVQFYSSSKLHIKNIQRDELGMFVCVAENTVGVDQKDIELLGYSAPDKPQILYAKGKSDQVTLYWNYIHDGGKPIQLITIEYRRDVELIWKKIQISTELKQYTVGNLLPESFYQFRVSLKNEIGESYFSDEYDVETKKKETTSKSTSDKPMMIGTINIIVLLSICGGILFISTCVIGGLCIYFQGKRIRRRKNTAREKRNRQKDIEMTSQNEKLMNHKQKDIEMTSQIERLVNHYST